MINAAKSPDTDPTLSHDADIRRVGATLCAVNHALRQLVVSAAARHSTEQFAPVLRLNCTSTTTRMRLIPLSHLCGSSRGSLA